MSSSVFSRYALVVFVLLLAVGSSYSQHQHLRCGTPDPSPEQIRYTIEHISKIAINRNAGTTKVPIKCHIYREDDGSGGVSNEVLARGLANLNNLYLDANIEFFYCGTPNYINNSDLYEFDGTAPDNDTEADLVAATTAASNAVNIFYVNSIVTSSGFNAAGYAYFPCNSPTCNRIVMDNGAVASFANGTYAHEFGHYFDLYHTHQGTEFGNTHSNAEHVPRQGQPNSNCLTDGDLLCDTEADPRYNSGHFDFSTCMDTGGEMDAFNNPYTPPVDNVMSYYPDACGGRFTPDQYVRIGQGLVERLGHSAYSLDCVPDIVNVPTGLTAALNADENGIDLNWTDAASNELGYIIERSTTSATAGFQALQQAGVADNVTSFTDNDITSNTTYWYRVKPINGDADLYSNVDDVIVGLIHCPAGGGCDEYISNVNFKTINNTTACSAGGYGKYTNLVANMQQTGETATITVTNGNPYTQDQCGIWVDWNQDGDFDDASETMTVAGSPGVGPYTASITPPNGAVLGLTKIRVRITWNTSPTSCNTHSYGEVEDYSLNLVNPLPVELLSFTGKRVGTNNLLNWETASETNNDYFELERKYDDRFETIAVIDGAGTISEAKSYNYTDRNALPGFNYYRLKQVDFDGQVSYSDIISIETKGEENFEVFPNPTRDLLNIYQKEINDEELQFSLLNAVGVEIALPSNISRDGKQTSVLDVSNLAVGVYFLQIRAGNKVYTKRFVKS